MLKTIGVPVCGGIACGPAFRYSRMSGEASGIPVGDAETELARFEAAVQRALADLQVLHGTALSGAGAEAAAIFEVHRMMLEDPNFRDAVAGSIYTSGRGAAPAVLEAGEYFAAQFDALPDEYLRGRAADVREIARRVADLLIGVEDPACLTHPVVLIADDLAPGEMIGLDSAKLLAIVLHGGSANSHTAVLARALDIPAVFGAGATLPAPPDGTELLVDGDMGVVIAAPDAPTMAAYEGRLLARAREKQRLAAFENAPCVTRGGIAVELTANVGGAGEVAAALEAGAAGVGLLRSEYLFLGRAACPTEDEQYEAYRSALEAAKGCRVVIRTLDIGADKRVSYLHMPEEENPALGCRALRLCFAQPELLHTQLCALYRASAHGTLAVMFPMIASEWELDAAIEAAAKARETLAARGMPFDAAVPLGVMIETPAAALLSAELAKKAAFFSIGTNDLTQYTLAADRQNAAAARYYNQRHPAVLRLIGLAAENAAEHGVPVAVCGELAAQPDAVPLLLSLGVRGLSVPPARVPAVLAAVRNCGAVERAL